MIRGRNSILIAFLSCITITCFGQVNDLAIGQDLNEPHPIEQFLIIDHQLNIQKEGIDFIDTYDEIIRKLEIVRQRKKSDRLFLRSIFYKVHQKNLIKYDKQATMGQTLLTGNFGCLSGTALYALILDHFNFAYDIIELPNHVFIQLQVEGQDMLIESTNPEAGLIKINQGVIAAMKQKGFDPRKIEALATVGVESVDEWNILEGHNKITLHELAGLQYFNEAVRLYIQKDYIKSMDMIDAAYTHYPSKRNEKLMQLVINKILKYDLIREELKNKYLEQYIKRIKLQKISRTK